MCFDVHPMNKCMLIHTFIKDKCMYVLVSIPWRYMCVCLCALSLKAIVWMFWSTSYKDVCVYVYVYYHWGQVNACFGIHPMKTWVCMFMCTSIEKKCFYVLVFIPFRHMYTYTIIYTKCLHVWCTCHEAIYKSASRELSP